MGNHVYKNVHHILQRDLYIVQLSRTSMRSKGKCPPLRINLLYEHCATIVFRALTLWYQAKAKLEMGGGGGYPDRQMGIYLLVD